MTDGTTNYSGILSNDDVAALTGKTLRYQPGTYYTVHYNTNAPSDYDVRYEVPDQSILGTGKLSRGTYYSFKGHKFSGWNTAADGSGTPYADMATVTLTADLTLYAQWDKYNNTVTWKNGNTTLETDETVAYGTMPSYDGETPTKASDTEYDYVFTGWYPTPDIVTMNVTYSAMFTSVPKAPSLANNADNSATISALATKGGTCNVTLTDRTLTVNNEWNTLCLPFSLTAEQIATSPLAGAIIKEMSTEDTSVEGTTLTLVFTSVPSITAGKPYIVKWETTGENITNPLFTGVTITSTEPTAVTSKDKNVTMVGQYSPFTIVESGASGTNEGNLNEIILMSTGNRMGYSASAPRTLKCFRCHFYVPVGVAGIKSFVLDFDGSEDTAISAVLNDNGQMRNDGWYDLSGRKLSEKPTTKGMYIHDGKKIMIK